MLIVSFKKYSNANARDFEKFAGFFLGTVNSIKAIMAIKLNIQRKQSGNLVTSEDFY